VNGWQSALDPQSLQAAGVARLIWFMMAVCFAIWLLVVAATGFALWRRQGDGERRPSRRLNMLVGGAIAGTVVIISIFTIASFMATRPLSASSDEALEIRVRGYQWWWAVDYLDSDRGFTTANEIHLPVGRPAHIHLAAMDVIHSFWVPNLAGKQDLIPGRDNDIWITPAEPGSYRGQCAEFCGMQHAHMSLLVIVESPQDFERWRGDQMQMAQVAATAEQQSGQAALESGACAACHTIRGTTARGTTGPDLTHVASRKFIAAGALENTRGSVAAWLADPQTIKPGNNMPMVSLSPGELRAISAYLAGLQ
jgi:cytochrome c oxidase subunit 2